MAIDQPLSKPQYLALSSPADWLVYGGAAGSGKTHFITLDPLRSCQGPTANRHFRGAIFRRTYPQMTKSGSLLDHCMEMYGQIGGVFNHTRSAFTFPNGSKIGLYSCQYRKNLDEFKGSAFDWLAIDEATEFPLEYVRFLWGRCRSKSGIRPVLRLTCNPDADSWLAKFVYWWIDQKTGLPIKERSGVIRHFTITGSTFNWFDEPQYGISEETGEYECITTSGTFTPGSLEDNVYLDRKRYRQNLEGLSQQEKERFLHGNWLASSNVDVEWPRECFTDIFIDGSEYPSPDLHPNIRIVRMFSLDASKGRREKSGDYSSICCVAQSALSDIKFVDADLERRPPGQIVSDLFLFCEQPHHRIASGDLIGIESLQFQELFLDIIAKYAKENPEYALSKYIRAGNIIIPVEDTLPKPLRIRRLDRFIRNQKLRFCQTPGTSLLVQQLRNFNGIQEKGKHDDGPDSLDMCLQLPRHLELYWEERRKSK